MFYVYILKDLGDPFYVGKGKGDRAYSHEKFARGEGELGFGIKEDYNPRKTKKIQKILKEGRTVEYDFIECDSEDNALQLEKDLIKEYGRRGIENSGILMNLTAGGIGGDTFSSLTEEQKELRRQRIANASRNRPPEVIEKIRKASTGRKHTKAAKDKISQSKQGSNNPMFGKVSPNRGKPATGGNAKGVREASNKVQIQQLDLDGNLVNIWPSMKSVMIAFEVSETQFYRALKLNKVLKGFNWIRAQQ